MQRTDNRILSFWSQFTKNIPHLLRSFQHSFVNIFRNNVQKTMFLFKQTGHELKTHLSSAFDIHKNFQVSSDRVLHIFSFFSLLCQRSMLKILTVMFKRCHFYAPLCLYRKNNIFLNVWYIEACSVPHCYPPLLCLTISKWVFSYWKISLRFSWRRLN